MNLWNADLGDGTDFRCFIFCFFSCLFRILGIRSSFIRGFVVNFLTTNAQILVFDIDLETNFHLRWTNWSGWIYGTLIWGMGRIFTGFQSFFAAFLSRTSGICNSFIRGFVVNFLTTNTQILVFQYWFRNEFSS